jgi:2-keto-4-pentenoate hydratase/2-oxohepta-3-ene-1,7-dioic acid hydratase (catechol pathway)
MYVIDPPKQASLAVQGSENRFPIRRIFCVGRNYEAHAREMGKDPTREAPFFSQSPRMPHWIRPARSPIRC